MARAKVDGGEVEDVILGCALQQGATGGNIARQAAIRAGLPVTAAGTTVDRQCSSGLQAISIASQRVMFDGLPVAIGGGLDSISLCAERAHELAGTASTNGCRSTSPRSTCR